MLLHHHGVLSLRSVVRSLEGREGDPTCFDPGLGQADSQWHALPSQSQDHSQGPQVT